MNETILPGGVANKGSVIRIGDTVRRPRGAHSDAVSDLLGHLERAGFDGVPRFLGIDEDGREMLSWIAGDVPLPPYPDWAMSDVALTSVGRLLRTYHDAVDGFVPSISSPNWSAELADPSGVGVLCHNDICPENVVFQDGQAAAFLDFDFAAPGRRVWDVVATASMWAPLTAPDWRKAYPAYLDAAARAVSSLRRTGWTRLTTGTSWRWSGPVKWWGGPSSGVDFRRARAGLSRWSMSSAGRRNERPQTTGSNKRSAASPSSSPEPADYQVMLVA